VISIKAGDWTALNYSVGENIMISSVPWKIPVSFGIYFSWIIPSYCVSISN